MNKFLCSLLLALAALPASATTKVDARMITGGGGLGPLPTCATGEVLTTDGSGLSCVVDALGGSGAWADITGKPTTFYTLPAATASVLGGVKGGGSCGLECCDGYTLKGLNSDGSIKCQAVGAALATVVSCDGAPPPDTAQLFFIDATGSPYCAGLGTPTAAAPIFSPAAGSYSGTQTVTVTSATSGATICYTVAGATPAATTPGTCDGGSNTYSTPVSVASSLTLKAIATKAAYVNSGVTSGAYTITIPQAAAPTFSPVAGAVADGSTITVTSGTSGATLYLDPFSPPTTARATATISGAATWYAQAKKASYTDSTISSAVYTLTGGGGDVTAPVVSLSHAGTSASTSITGFTFTATDAVGVTHYSLLQSTAGGSAAACSTISSWTLTSAPTTATVGADGVYQFRGCAKDAAGNVSTGATASVTVTQPQAATPTFSPVAGEVASGATVTTSTATGACSSYLYLDPTTNPPTTLRASVAVSTPETLYAKVIGCPGYTDSAVGSAAYTLAAGGTSVSDLFTRINNTDLGTGWGAQSGIAGRFKILTNAVTVPAPGTDAADRRTETFAANQYAEALVNNTSQYPHGTGVYVRSSASAATFYAALALDEDTSGEGDIRTLVKLYKVAAGTWTELGSWTRDPATTWAVSGPLVVRLEASGTSLVVKTATTHGGTYTDRIGGTAGVVTDSAIGSGSPGVYGQGGVLDDFYAGDLP